MGSLRETRRTLTSPARRLSAALRRCLGIFAQAEKRCGIILAPLLLLLGASALRAEPLAPIDLIRVDKSERRMELWSGGRVVSVIEHIQLGDQPLGPKRFEGDERTPEGRYQIDWGNPDSAYHLSLHISYPNTADREYAAGQGRSPGGMIMIHGQPNGSDRRPAGDWTDGCIAVSNAQIEMLWQSVGDGTPIEILP
ncbi:L,D-transpeptidase family protein [Novosphingobium clariflavum]|uniref:Murein L,D-transpeptidase family protein n=1 Tax=Novosphingobium clariflavum TaxID=2029884 RepID=A0ABV6S3X1_9SPHN|nr:L,D-transpeptidase family protein [Novosphingobium clariflavum]